MRYLSLWCGVVWCGVVRTMVGRDVELQQCWHSQCCSVSLRLRRRVVCRYGRTVGGERRRRRRRAGRAGLSPSLVTTQHCTGNSQFVSPSLSPSLSFSKKKMVSSKTIKYFCLTGAGVTSSQSNKTQQEITFFLQPSHCASACSIKMIFLTEKMKFELVVVS